MTVLAIAPSPGLSDEARTLARGLATGLAAATIGALYVVFARWGIQRGASAMDLTALRFGVSGLILLPVLIAALRRVPALLSARWRVWLAVSALARAPFGLLMFGALQFAPASHAAVFPFAAMSVMGMLLGALVPGDRLTPRRAGGIAVVLGGLVLVSGVSADSFTAAALLGDPDMELRDLPVEVARHEALTEQLDAMHLGLGAAAAMVAAPSSPDRATEAA